MLPQILYEGSGETKKREGVGDATDMEHDKEERPEGDTMVREKERPGGECHIH